MRILSPRLAPSVCLRVCLGVCLGACLAFTPLAPVAPVGAAELVGLYEAEIPVADKQAGSREAALSAALRQVLIKITGRRDPGSGPVIAEAIRAPGRFVQQYQYRAPAATVEDEAPELLLWTRFDADVVDAVVRDAGFPVWGRTRPALLLWTALDDGTTRELLGPDDLAGVVAGIERGASLRGIPMVVPLLDLEDQIAISSNDLWAGFFDPIRAASARYETEAVLVVRVRRLENLGEAQWTLLLPDGSAQHWQTQSDVEALLLEDGMHAAADLLAERYSDIAGVEGPGQVSVVVTGIGSIDDYARALSYLDSLGEVERVEVAQVQTGQVRFDLQVRGGRAAIRQVVGLGSTLAPEGYAGPDSELQMRLLP